MWILLAGCASIVCGPGTWLDGEVCRPDDDTDADDTDVDDTDVDDTDVEDTDVEDTDVEDTDPPPSAGWYVDCGGGDDLADGRTPDTAWATVAPVNALTLAPGDAVYLRRGTTCPGFLAPKGSGDADHPIRVGAWGDGARPILDATGFGAGLALWDQSYWEVADLEIVGPHGYGVYVGAYDRAVRHVHLTDLRVHGVSGEPWSKLTGLVVVAAEYAGARFEDVVIDGVEAFDTTQWAGIIVYGRTWADTVEKSSDVTIRNSVVHDVAGDGIVIFSAQDAVIETSYATEIGQQVDETLGTPNAIWTWDCDRCTVQYNEASHSHSPGVDGGLFDIDWGSTDTTVQYNYGHDADSYCVAVFGAEGVVTRDAVVRYNVCAANGRDGEGYANGDIFVYTWNGGSIDGVRIYNNTSFWDPIWSAPALVVAGDVTGDSFYTNNLVYATKNWFLVADDDAVQMDHNLWYAEGANGWFNVGDGWYDGVSSFRAETGQESGSLQRDPWLTDPGWTATPGRGAEALTITASSPAIDAGRVIPDAPACDFWGGSVGAAPDIGAHELGATACSR